VGGFFALILFTHHFILTINFNYLLSSTINQQLKTINR